MKHVLIVLALLCSLCLHAKEGKIKYGKYVIYEGQIEDKQPKGHGVLILTESDNESFIKIEGEFNGNTITKVKVDGIVHDYGKVNVGSINVVYNDIHNKNTDIEFIFNDVELYLERPNVPSTIGGIAIKKLKIDISKVVLHCEKSQNEYSGFYLNFSYKFINKYTTGTVGILSMPDILKRLNYNDISMVDKGEIDVELQDCAGKYLDNTNNIIKYIDNNGDYFSLIVLKDGTEIEYNKITYPNGDKIEITNDGKGWIGTRHLSDGTKVTSEKVRNNYIINITKLKEKETYTGSLEDIFAPLYPKSTYAIYTGTQTVNGITTKWIKGETFEARHERLKNILSPKWLALVEAGQVSETQARVAIQNEKDEKRRAEESKKREEEEAKKREEYLKKHPEKKKKYHEVGKMENCWMCFGSGLAPKIVDKPQRPCYNCAGKGWYIEHYW